MQSLPFRRIAILLIFALVSNIFVLSIFTQQADAVVNLSQASMVLYRMGVSRPVSNSDPILIIAKPATAVASASRTKISFAPNFSFAANTNLITISTGVAGTLSLPMTIQNQVVSAWPMVSASPVVLATTDVAFTGGALVAGSIYGFFITAGVTNPGTTAGNPYVSTITTYASSDTVTPIDSSRVAVATTTSSGDQVVVTASVPPTFSFSLGSNAIALGDLSTSTTKNGNVVATLSTNAGNGYIMWLRGQGGSDTTKAALASVATGNTILTVGTPGTGACSAYSSGNDYYQLSATFAQGGGGGGVISTNPAYDCGNSTFLSGGAIGKTYQEVERSSGTANGDTVTLYAMAAAGNLDKAATDYTDTWTVVAAGNF